jgi:hypothetical protein
MGFQPSSSFEANPVTDFLLETFPQTRQIPDFTFPNNDDPPTGFPKQRFRSAITCDVFAELLLPEADPTLGCVCKFTARMAMPKASMNQNHCSIFH